MQLFSYLCIPSFLDEALQLTYSPVFDSIVLPAGPYEDDHVWTLTVKIRDVYGATTVVYVQAKIGEPYTCASSSKALSH